VSPARQAKITTLIRNADLYDLIRMAIRASDNKHTVVDSYIQKALLKNQQQHHRREESDYTEYTTAEIESEYAKLEREL
jgi:hypothetical protein